MGAILRRDRMGDGVDPRSERNQSSERRSRLIFWATFLSALTVFGGVVAVWQPDTTSPGWLAVGALILLGLAITFRKSDHN